MMANMTTPEAPHDTSGRQLAFDLVSLAQELRAEPSYTREGQTARTLVRSSDLRVVLVVMRAGKTMSEHHAKVTASVQTLEGRLHLGVAAERIELPVGQLLVLPPGLAHDVTAEVDSAFLLTLGWQAAQ